MSKKRVEVVGWHNIAIKTVNNDQNCSLEVLTTQPGRIISALADPDVVAVSWEFGAQEYLVRTEHIVRVIVESLEPAHLDNSEREELLETATATTASVMFRTRTPDESGRWWTQLWPPSEDAKP